uniref:Uncharacterized protein n=1 Tax=Anopheles farauti TaxID=69004 RepID=A0A182QAF6_9DIPT
MGAKSSASSMIRSEVLLAVVVVVVVLLVVLPLLLAIIAGDCGSDLPFVVGTTMDSPFVPSLLVTDSIALPFGHFDTLSFCFLSCLALGFLSFGLLAHFLLATFAFFFISSTRLLDGLLQPFLLHTALLFGQPDCFLFQFAQAFFFLQDALSLSLLFGLNALAFQFRLPFGFLACQTTTFRQSCLCLLLGIDTLCNHRSGHCITDAPGSFDGQTAVYGLRHFFHWNNFCDRSRSFLWLINFDLFLCDRLFNLNGDYIY